MQSSSTATHTGDVNASSRPGGSSGSWLCDICTQSFQEMMFLPCGHRYCERCLRVWVGVYVDSYRSGLQEFPCRVCWHYFHIPSADDGGLNAFRRSHAVDCLGLEFMTQLSMDTTTADESDDAVTEHHTETSQPRNYPSIAQSDYQNSNVVCCEQNSFLTAADQWRKQSDANLMDNSHKTQSAENVNQTVAISSENWLAQQTAESTSGQADVTMDDETSNVASVAMTSSTNQCTSTFPLTADGPMPYSRQRLCFPSCHTYMYHLA